MADNSHIEWTDATWNPITGCSVVSPGCTNCYAMRLAGTRLKDHPSRAGLTEPSKAGPVWNGQVRWNLRWLEEPLRWKRSRRIFVCAHGDLFHEAAPDAWIDQVFAIMALAPQHTFQVLTKRAARMRAYASDPAAVRRIYEEVCDLALETGAGVLILPGTDASLAPPGPRIFLDRWPLPNVWLGVSAEDQARADERIPDLLATPAAKRFLSAEPLLGRIDLTRLETFAGERIDALHGISLDYFDEATRRKPRLDWVIVGGESGPGARPMHPDLVRRIRDDCDAAGVPFFFKQWGRWSLERPPEGSYWHDFRPSEETLKLGPMMWPVGKTAAGALLDGVEHRAFPA